MDLGMSGIGLYWCLVECLYENKGYLDLEELDLLAYELQVDKNDIEKLINNYDLFRKNKKSFFSKSVLQRLEKINEKSNKARASVQKRWENQQNNDIQTKNESNTNVLPTQYYIKEKKIKENKNKIKESIIITTSNNISKKFGRKLVSPECSKIEEWLLLYKQELILYAADIAVLNNIKTFNYMQGILSTWESKNLKTLSEIKEFEEKLKQNKYSKKDIANEEPLFDYDWLNDPDSTLTEDIEGVKKC